jgi:hypothetical protein
LAGAPELKCSFKKNFAAITIRNTKKNLKKKELGKQIEKKKIIKNNLKKQKLKKNKNLKIINNRTTSERCYRLLQLSRGNKL